MNNNSQSENASTMSLNADKYLSPIPIFTLITNIYITPIVSLIGFIFNVPCLIVLMHPKLKGDTYKYLIYKTLTHLIFLFLITIAPIFRCTTCKISLTLFANLMRWLSNLCLLNVLTTYATLVEIALSYDRLLMLMQQKPKYLIKLSFWPTTISFSVLGFVLNMPYMFLNRIEQVPGADIWLFVRNDFNFSTFYRLYGIIFSLLQAIPPLIVIVVLNIFVKIEFGKYLNRKKNLTLAPRSSFLPPHTELVRFSNLANLNSVNRKISMTNIAHLPRKSKDQNNSAEINFIMMILVASVFYSVTRLFFFLNNGTFLLLQQLGINTPLTSYLSFLSFFSAIVYYGSNLFIYIFFNKMFKACFREIFHV
jgi:hypothetical protein